jgi:hypothetical protein
MRTEKIDELFKAFEELDSIITYCSNQVIAYSKSCLLDGKSIDVSGEQFFKHQNDRIENSKNNIIKLGLSILRESKCK